MLTTEQRRENYKAQRNGGQLTAKQRRRIRKQEHKSLRVTGTLRVSRLRKAYDKADRLRNRRTAIVVINSIRSGMLRPSRQAQLRAEQHKRDYPEAS